MGPMTTDPTDPGRCPLCGGDKRCTMEMQPAAGEPHPPCGRTTQGIDPWLLARFDEEALT
jgi:hypothetical protein